jgi:NhaA family Na+:H+ antiporter
MTLLRRAGVHHVVVYVVLGTGVWWATYQSGVHATIAGVALGLLTPARPVPHGLPARGESSTESADQRSPEDPRGGEERARATMSVAERLQHALHPLSSFVIVPIFALANAGVGIDADAFDAPDAGRIAIAAAVGLVLGKLVGVLGATWLAVRAGLGRLPEDSTWGQVAGIGAVAGIGFTVSLFITGLAFDAPTLQSAAKIGVLIGSVVAAGLGSLVLVLANRLSHRR